MRAASLGVTAPAGFRASGVSAGLKASGALDVALIVNDGPRPASAGVFTKNRVQAAPVVWTRRAVSRGHVRGVLVNSGGANACTGEAGYQDTVNCAERTAKQLQLERDAIAVCSTGLIGERLDMGALLPGIDNAYLELCSTGGLNAAAAIMTTDTVAKSAERTEQGVTVGGIAKGAGMLAPGLATMLAVLTTDAVVDPVALNDVLKAATSVTFDRVDSDGCMSTNDTVLILASGSSGVTVDPGALRSLVTDVCGDLCRQLVADAEGATKDICIEATSAATVDDALTVARSVARSALFKCAVHGEDPNWGRVLSAVGTTDALFDPARLSVAINGLWVARGGAAASDRKLVDLSQREVSVVVDLAAGVERATIWTNDLTAAYVHENSVYSS